MKPKRVIILCVLIVCLFSNNQAPAAKVDTVVTFSPAMNKSIKAVIVTPDEYRKSKSRFPVVYILHGYNGNFANYVKNVPELTGYSDQFKMIFVCPDGLVGSWYFDSPVDPAWKFETYIATELVGWIDKIYRTIPEKKARAITGLSMGGHGALYLAFKHPDVFGAAGSMSGGVDFRPFPTKWDIEKRLGSYVKYPDTWNQNTVTNMLDRVKPGSLALIIDCGYSDFFFTVNEAFHKKLIEHGIDHDYIVRPGAHNWQYWRNSIGYQLLFMNNFFHR